MLRDGVGGAGSLAAGGFGKVVLLGKVDLVGKVVDVDGECLGCPDGRVREGIRGVPVGGEPFRLPVGWLALHGWWCSRGMGAGDVSSTSQTTKQPRLWMVAR